MIFVTFFRSSDRWKHALFEMNGPAPKLKITDCPLKGDVVGLIHKGKQKWFQVQRREFVYSKGELNNVRIIVKKFKVNKK